MSSDRRLLALDVFTKAFDLQKQGELELAAGLYKRSIEIMPTAEAHTFLGWTYSLQGRLDEAVEECKRAIAIDPDYGNPYNDIGAYLIDLGRPKEALGWLEMAANSRRYHTYHYAWYNMGRAWTALECFSSAKECFETALDIEPGYRPAEDALEKVRRVIQ